MTNAGPGFPHVFLGTTHPGSIGIGKGEALVFWGRLERSPYVEDTGHPLISGLVLGYEPRWIPGLHLGLGRVMLQRWQDLRFRDYLSIFQSFQKRDLQSWYGPEGNNPFDNQIASLFGRWVFPEVGLEIYGEWAREDHDWTWWTFIREPDHSQAYLLGLQKIFRAGPRLVRLHAELSHLQEIRPKEELDRCWECCPIDRYKKELISRGVLDAETDEKILRECEAEIDQAVKFADESPFPEPAEMCDDVYADGTVRGGRLCVS